MGRNRLRRGTTSRAAVVVAREGGRQVTGIGDDGRNAGIHGDLNRLAGSGFQRDESSTVEKSRNGIELLSGKSMKKMYVPI